MTELPRGFYIEEMPATVGNPDGGSVIVMADDDMDKRTDPDTGATIMETDDGGVVIDLNPQAPGRDLRKALEEHNTNLADYLSEDELNHIGSELLMAIDADDQSRSEWLQARTKGIDLLGFKVDEVRSAAATGAPVDGMSSVRHPLLSEAVIRFQSNAAAELFPADGPVRVRDDSAPAPSGVAADAQGSVPYAAMGLTKSDLAEALERDFNHYLTKVDKGYRSDSVRMLFWVGFGGCGFKKVYNDPVLRRPVSRSVDAQDLIVNNNANDIDDAGRVTHRIKMRYSVFRRMQIAGVYRDAILLSNPIETPDPVQVKVSQTQGFAPTPQRPEDHEYTVYECYCELDLPGFEHKDDEGNPTGLPLPYKVSIEKDSRVVLEIRRNWRQDDDTYQSRKRFVKYPFVPALGFYDIGLLQLIGNTDKALTGAWRLMLDSGTFANFPGFLYSKSMARQQTNEFRIAPGSGMAIDTGDKPIGNAVMPLPYKDLSPAFAALAKEINEAGQRLGGTAELQVAEGRQDAPVGTTLAMVEQATKIMSAVHINLHAAQAEEFQLLKECFQEDPEAFWRHNRKPAKPWEVDEFLAALDDADLVPAADPNTSSHMHRVMKLMAIKQLQGANPMLYDARAVDLRVMRMLHIDSPEQLFAPPPPPGAAPPPDPKMLQVQAKLKGQEDQLKLKAAQAAQQAQNDARADQVRLQEVMTESADRAADRASRERVAQTRQNIEETKLVAQREQQEAQRQLEAEKAALQHGLHPAQQVVHPAGPYLHDPNAIAGMGTPR